MSATVTIHHPPGQLDRFSEAVLASFSRPISKPLYRGTLWVVLMTAITLGLWPMWKSIRWMRDYAAVREQRCWHLAEWLRIHRNEATAAQLQTLALAIRPNLTIAAVMKAMVIVAFVSLFTFQHGPIYQTLFEMPRTDWQHLYAALLCGVSILLLLQLYFHQDHFHRFLSALNPTLSRYGLRPVSDVGFFSFNLLDWFAGAALASQGAAWPIFTIVSIGLFRSYVRRSMRVHAELGDRVRDLLRTAAPPLNLPGQSDFLNRCVNVQCGAILANDAKFCARCGTGR